MYQVMYLPLPEVPKHFFIVAHCYYLVTLNKHIFYSSTNKYLLGWGPKHKCHTLYIMYSNIIKWVYYFIFNFENYIIIILLYETVKLLKSVTPEWKYFVKSNLFFKIKKFIFSQHAFEKHYSLLVHHKYKWA